MSGGSLFFVFDRCVKEIQKQVSETTDELSENKFRLKWPLVSGSQTDFKAEQLRTLQVNIKEVKMVFIKKLLSLKHGDSYHADVDCRW